ncbi:TetR/AcrR family transcriptional regulator [Streptomyces sp. WAC01280]|uniref:TetR/AcrR family transcriptional regulator n=1 Tax=Streptomyces sp. WAC01280 TaxID=2487424 RepID=UPI000F7761A2|nr:TetR/AcrR family transcriptional regulator [Streptomyces sp. WAC01280]RSS56749.1 TetR/AcrR family transcriptional regulator [Streptomyces sp. WAC01280]
MSTPRGPYAKTSVKRQQIIEAALAAYAEAGSRKVSVRDIAQRVGMTDAGVLHHFGSREALLTAVLKARDVAARAAFGEARDDLRAGLDIVTHNASTPGLVKLFVDVAAAAAEPEHPAHGFFQDRYANGRRNIAGQLARHLGDSEEQSAAEPATSVDPEWAARILLAATDGLQLQWLLEPDIDMAADLTALYSVLMDALRKHA